jgi:hypothetical protein
MMGPKKLSTIRGELRRALAETGEDPIRWLDEHIALSERQGTAPSGNTAVIRSLRRLLEKLKKPSPKRKRSGSKKYNESA